MVESSYANASVAISFSTAHENHEYDSSRTVNRRLSRMDMINNNVGYVYGVGSPGDQTDNGVCEADLLPNIESQCHIGPDVDPYAEYERREYKARSEYLIYRRLKVRNGTEIAIKLQLRVLTGDVMVRFELASGLVLLALPFGL